MICTYIPLCNYAIYPLTAIGFRVGAVIWLFKHPTVPVLNQVQNQRTSVSSFWREKVRNQRTTSSGYFQKHQRTEQVVEERTRKEPAVRKAVFFWIFSKKLRRKGLYQNSDRFFIKKIHPQNGKWVYMQCTQCEWVYVCVPRLSGKEGFEGRLPW